MGSGVEYGLEQLNRKNLPKALQQAILKKQKSKGMKKEEKAW